MNSNTFPKINKGKKSIRTLKRRTLEVQKTWHTSVFSNIVNPIRILVIYILSIECMQRKNKKYLSFACGSPEPIITHFNCDLFPIIKVAHSANFNLISFFGLHLHLCSGTEAIRVCLSMLLRLSRIIHFIKSIIPFHMA